MIIRSAKFLSPVRPGASLALQWEPAAGGAIKFECRPEGQDGLILTGLLASA
jgi:3-hydroxymyristoyl/3-hydroxydecanoyl-(acyl carrier protein) dehydratase